MTDLIERMKEALVGVTDGPWAYDMNSICLAYDLDVVIAAMYANTTDADAKFIATARTLLPEAIEEIKRLQELLADIQSSQTYTYYGKDWKPVLARDLEDRAEAAEAKLAKALGAMAKAHVIMRECGWHLAPAAEPESDGVLELAVCEIEEEFDTTIAELTGGKEE